MISLHLFLALESRLRPYWRWGWCPVPQKKRAKAVMKAKCSGSRLKILAQPLESLHMTNTWSHALESTLCWTRKYTLIFNSFAATPWWWEVGFVFVKFMCFHQCCFSLLLSSSGDKGPSVGDRSLWLFPRVILMLHGTTDGMSLTKCRLLPKRLPQVSVAIRSVFNHDCVCFQGFPSQQGNLSAGPLYPCVAMQPNRKTYFWISSLCWNTGIFGPLHWIADAMRGELWSLSGEDLNDCPVQLM